MRLSFDSMLEQLEKKDILMDSGEDTKASQVVQAGLNISSEFWDNFKTLFANVDGIAELFDIPREKVPNIPAKIQEIMNKIDSKNKKEKFI